MNISSIFLLIAFLAGIGIVITWPFWAGKSEALSSTAGDSLEAQHEGILKAIRDLDFDFQLGKLSQDDYRTQRETLTQRGVNILKEIDRVKGAQDPIESAIQAARKSGGSK
jgi:hypothetical protein